MGLEAALAALLEALGKREAEKARQEAMAVTDQMKADVDAAAAYVTNARNAFHETVDQLAEPTSAAAAPHVRSPTALYRRSSPGATTKTRPGFRLHVPQWGRRCSLCRRRCRDTCPQGTRSSTTRGCGR